MQLRYVFPVVLLSIIFSSVAFSQNYPVNHKGIHNPRIQKMLQKKYRRNMQNTDFQINRLKEQELRTIDRIANLEQEIKSLKQERSEIRKNIKELISKSIKEKNEEKEKIKKDEKEQLSMKEKEIESLKKLQREMEKD